MMMRRDAQYNSDVRRIYIRRLLGIQTRKSDAIYLFLYKPNHTHTHTHTLGTYLHMRFRLCVYVYIAVLI